MRRIRRRIADGGKSCEMCCLVDGARGGGDGGWGMGDLTACSPFIIFERDRTVITHGRGLHRHSNIYYTRDSK
jgi:hypothetical protein